MSLRVTAWPPGAVEKYIELVRALDGRGGFHQADIAVLTRLASATDLAEFSIVDVENFVTSIIDDCSIEPTRDELGPADGESASDASIAANRDPWVSLSVLHHAKDWREDGAEVIFAAMAGQPRSWKNRGIADVTLGGAAIRFLKPQSEILEDARKSQIPAAIVIVSYSDSRALHKPGDRMSVSSYLQSMYQLGVKNVIGVVVPVPGVDPANTPVMERKFTGLFKACGFVEAECRQIVWATGLSQSSSSSSADVAMPYGQLSVYPGTIEMTDFRDAIRQIVASRARDN